jgi:hypothetical protein
MGSCLGIGGATRADDANVTMPLDETDVEQAGCGIVTDNNLSLFGFGMVRIRKNRACGSAKTVMASANAT